MNINEANGLCIGCGICAGTCTASIHMDIESTKNVPVVDKTTCVDCGKCVRVCPLLAETPQEPQGQQHPAVGSYRHCYMGKSNTLVKISASGGMATAFLLELLQSGTVDAIVTVRQTSNPDQLFEYFFAETKEELLTAVGSAYYPVEISTALSQIISGDKNVAVVGLPCVLRGIRNVMKLTPSLQNKIKVLVGLACGGLGEKSMVEYVAEKNGIKVNDITRLSFRKKVAGVECKDSCMLMETSDGKTHQSFYYAPKALPQADAAFGRAYLNKLFGFDACMVCTDALAEAADIVFMDAWLPEVNEEVYGTSMIVARSETAVDVCEKLATMPNIELRTVPAEEIIRAQRNVNLIQTKKEEAHYRRIHFKRKIVLPPEHCYLDGISFTRKIKLRLKALLQIRLQHYAKEGWLQHKNGDLTLAQFDAGVDKRLYH